MTKLTVRKSETGLRNLDRFLGDIFEDMMDPFMDFDMFGMKVPYYKSKVDETDKEYIFEIALPGANKDEISIEAHKGRLTVNYIAKKISEKSFSSKSFSESWLLPLETKEEEVGAEYKDGILRITIPKIKELPTEEDSPKRIEIK